MSVMVALPRETDSMPFFFPKSPTTFSVFEVELGFTVSTRWTLDCWAIADFAAARTEVAVLAVANAGTLSAAEMTSAPVPNARARTRRGMLDGTRDFTSVN